MCYPKGAQSLAGLMGCACRRPTSLWWSTLEKIPRPHPPPCFFPSSVASPKPTRYKYLMGRVGALQPLPESSGAASVGEDSDGGGGLFSPRPALGPQKAEQEVEQWKKEAAADTSGREEPPAPKVGVRPQAQDWDSGTCSIPFTLLPHPYTLSVVTDSVQGQGQRPRSQGRN